MADGDPSDRGRRGRPARPLELPQRGDGPGRRPPVRDAARRRLRGLRARRGDGPHGWPRIRPRLDRCLFADSDRWSRRVRVLRVRVRLGTGQDRSSPDCSPYPDDCRDDLDQHPRDGAVRRLDRVWGLADDFKPPAVRLAPRPCVRTPGPVHPRAHREQPALRPLVRDLVHARVCARMADDGTRRVRHGAAPEGLLRLREALRVVP